jgi:3-hydroxyisobutyrate dehydrogenase-like beta-hydroxyacid dehydrogenase
MPKISNGSYADKIQAAKICNNLALAVSMAGISEALALGQKLGIDAHTLSKIFNTSSARCWSRFVFLEIYYMSTFVCMAYIMLLL